MLACNQTFQFGQVALKYLLCAFEHREKVLCGLGVATAGSVPFDHFFLSSDGKTAQFDLSTCTINAVGD
jgi:hypothetical protein